MSLIVRPIQYAEGPQAARIHVEAWVNTVRGLMPDHLVDTFNLVSATANWEKILSDPAITQQVLSLGAFRDGAMLGLAGAGLPRENWGYDSELWAIHVPKRFQKMGVGKALMQACVAHCLGFSARSMYLRCVIGNDNAMQFYHYLGARDTDRILVKEGYRERILVWDDLHALAARLS